MLSRYGEIEGRFSDDEIADKIEDFEELAASRCSNAPTGRFLLAAGIFGALVIPCGLPAAGAIALPVLVNAIRSATKNGKQAEYVAKTGNFCHLLNDREIAQLIRFTGRRFIVDQCAQAHIDGMRLSRAAIELVEMMEEKLTPSTFAEIKRAYAPQTTIETKASEFDPQVGAAAVSTKSERTAARSRSHTALARVLADPYESRAIFGAQRTGKSYFAAIATKEIGCKIFHLNLASFEDEDKWYWQHAYKSLTADLTTLDAFSAGIIVKDAIALVHEFYASQEAILVIDEIVYIGSVNNRHKDLLIPLLSVIADKITTLSSSGKKREKAIWTIAPEFVAGSLMQDAKAIKKLKLCYLTIAPGQTVDWNGQAIGFSSELFDQIKNNYPVAQPPAQGAIEDERIALIDEVWSPLGELPPLPKYSDPREQLEAILNSEGTSPVEEFYHENQASNIELKPSEKFAEKLAMMFPQWKQQSIEIAEKILVHISRSPEGLKAHEIKSKVAYLKNNDDLKKGDQSITIRILKKLIEGRFILESRGSYFIQLEGTSNDFLSDFD